MAFFTTLDAAVNSQFVLIGCFPFLETSVLSVSNMVAFATLYYISFVAVSGLMPNLVAFETHFFVAVKRLVSVFAAKDAVETLGVIGTFSSHVAELLAVVAFHSDVFLSPVTLSFHLL